MPDKARGRITGGAIVTGGGQGLGRAYALGLAEQGASVVVADLNADNSERVAAEIRTLGGVAIPAPVDVSDRASVGRMVSAARDAYGPPAVLINNAAIFSTLKMRPFSEIPDDEWDRVMAVNVRGAFNCSRATVPLMAEAGYGKIINISSSTIWMGRPFYLHYVTSKAALLGFTRALASEVGPMGIRVNAITPGSTQTEIERATVTAEQRAAMASQTALRRGEVAEDLVGTVLFLASHESDFITGQTINVDGGFSYH